MSTATTWNSAGSTDANNAANYSAALPADAVVTLDNTSVINWIFTANMSVESITIAVNYTGVVTMTGFTLGCSLGFSDDGITGTHTYGTSITCAGASSTFHSNPGGTLAATTCDVILNGTTGMTLDVDKDTTFMSLTLGANAKVTSSGSATTYFSSATTPLTLGASATLTNNADTRITLTATASIVSLGAGYTINGTGAFRFYAGANAITITVPALSITGTNSLVLFADSPVGFTGVTYSFSGALAIGAIPLYVVCSAAASQLIHDFNGQNITCGDLLVGGLAAFTTGTQTVKYGSGTHTIASYTGATYNTPTTEQFQTSQWTCTGDWTFGSNHTITNGTEVLNLTGGAAQTITTNGKALYDVTINRVTAGTCLFSGATSLHTLTVSATNTQAVSWTGTTMTASGNITVSGGTVNFGTGVTLTGTSSALTTSSTSGTITATSCAFVFNGTSNTLVVGKTFTGKTLTLGASAVLVNSGASYCVFSSATTPLTLGASATLTANGDMAFDTSGSVAIYSLGAGYTLNGNKLIEFGVSANSITVTIPETTYTGTGSLRFNDAGTGRTTVVWSITGAINTGTRQLQFVQYYASTATVNFGAYAVTCGGFVCGNGTTIALNFSSATVSVSSFTFTNAGGETFNTVGTTINLQTSQWTCTGAWTFGSNWTVDPGTSLLNLTGAAQTVTSAGKTLYDVTINRATAGTCLFSGAVSLHTLIASATNTQVISWTGTTMTASGNITLDGSGTHIFGNGITLTGASSNFHIGSTLTAPTATSCALAFTGATAPVLDDDIGTTFKSLTVGTAALAVLTSSGAAMSTFSNTATPFTTFAGSTVTFTQAVKFIGGASITMFSIGAGTTFNGVGSVTVEPGANTLTLTIPAVTYTGSGTWVMYEGTGAYTPTIFALSGAFDIGSSSFLVYAAAAGKTVTFTTANNAVTCGTLRWGANAANTFTVTASASVYTIAIYDGATYDSALGTTTINMSTAAFNCSGSWSFGANHVVTHAGDVVTITGTSTITSNLESFYDLVINSGVNTATLADALVCTTLGLTSGAFDQNGQTITCSTFTWNSNDAATDFDAAITCSGNVTRGAASAGTITGTVTISGPSTITSNGLAWYDFVFGAGVSAITLADGLACRNLTHNTGALAQGGFAITCTGTVIFNSAGANVLTGTWNVAVDWTWGAAAAANIAAMVLNMTNAGAHTITTNGNPFNTLNLAGNTAFIGGSIINLLSVAAGVTVACQAGQTYVFTTHVDGGWDGATFTSTIAGNQAFTFAPNMGGGLGPNVSATSWQDIDNNLGFIIMANDGTNADLGNNENIFFAGMGGGPAHFGDCKAYVSATVGL